VTVQEVKERILPALNDQFADRLDMGKTVLELKLNLRKRIEADKKAEIERFRRQAVINQMTDKNDFDVPQVMLESYLKGAVKEYKQQLPDADENQLREKYRPVGIRTIRWHLIFHRLARQEQIEVLPSDTENWIKRFADNYRMDVAKAKEVLARTGKADEVKDSILEEKVLDFLLEKTDVTEMVTEAKEGK
jgi:trigger factor